MSVTNNKHYFLSGGGEMGELIRAKDWSKTPLGDPDTWPQSLRTMVAVMLENPFGMYIAWGNDFTQLYNDGYRPILGATKHPQALEISTTETFSEIWDTIGPMLKYVMKGNAIGFSDMKLTLNRNGYHEECYFDFAYSPIRTDNGKVGGVLVTVVETTEKKRATDALKESNDRFLKSILQSPIAMCIFRGKDHVLEIANQPMLDIWGKNVNEVLNKPVFEGLPEAKNQGLEALLDGVFETGEKFTANERLVKLPRNGNLESTYLSFVYEALKETDGTISGVLAIATDVTSQVMSRTTLEESRNKLRAIVENSPFAIAVYMGEEMRIELANEAIINIWGKGSDVIGKTFTELLPELKGQLVFEQIKNVFKTGVPFYSENTPIEIVKDGKRDTYFFNYGFTPLYDLSGNIYAVMNTGVDLTELNTATKKIEEANKRFRSTVMQAPVGITILRGKDYVVEMANEAYLQLVDRDENSFVGKPLFESLPEVKQVVSTLLENVFNTGIAYHGYEVPIPLNRHGKEEISYFDFLYHPLREENGEISGIIVTVTEVKEKVEARLKTERNEEKLNIIVEASELGTWELNVKTREVKYSQRYLEILGGYQEEVKLTHDQLLSHLHPDDLHIREKGFRNAITSGYLQYEARVVWIDKSIHWMQGKGKVFYDEDNKPDKMIGTIRDITSERKYQQELEENEKKFRLLADSMPQHIWTSDPEGNLNYFNQSVFDYSGITPEQIEKDGWIQIVHPDDKEGNIKAWTEAITTGKDFLFEHRFRRHDGEYRWQLSRAMPQTDENGTIQMWVGTSTDIQDQKTFTNELEKQVEARTKELRLTNESLKKSEERYHLMVEEVQDYAILYINVLGFVENWNLGAQKIKGYKADEIIGKNFSVFYTEEDRNNGLPQKLLKVAKETGKAKQEGWRVRKNGSLFWASVTITAVHNDKNEVIGFSKVTHDLTERKVADDLLKANKAELEVKNKELEKMNKELQSFAYISSHDLQEPLRKIQAFSTLIMEKEVPNLSDNGKDIFNRMHSAANRMQVLINDLLAYSRTNIQERKFEKADLAKIIKEVKEDMAEELEAKMAVIEHPEKCILKIIPFQFRQLIYNLVSNALKFAKEDVPPLIQIEAHCADAEFFNHSRLTKGIEYCHISIADNGIGFEQEYSEKIFEVFQRLHGRSQYTGTGIGLAIVKRIVDNHRGIISARGEKNGGATFDIYIPML